jgi:hypothetical protein
MYRWFALAGILPLAVLVAGIQAEEEKEKPKDDAKPKSIGAFMKKAHAGDGALKAAVTKALKDEDFKKAAAPMKAWKALAAHLGSFDPPKGDKADWKIATKEYGAEVDSLAKAINAKEAKDAEAALKKINMSCMTCHMAHRKPPKKKKD